MTYMSPESVLCQNYLGRVGLCFFAKIVLQFVGEPLDRKYSPRGNGHLLPWTAWAEIDKTFLRFSYDQSYQYPILKTFYGRNLRIFVIT
jgi:hypothetical protein